LSKIGDFMDKELGGKDNMFLLSSSRYSDIQIFNTYISDASSKIPVRVVIWRLQRSS
jgi:hypothetical protein